MFKTTRTNYYNKLVTNLLIPPVTLTIVAGYFNRLIHLRSYYLVIIELSLIIILPYQLLVGNN
jgi:hypothetical protein